MEALSLGAKKERIEELALKWNCTNDDARNYASYLGINIGFDGNQMTAKKSDFINLQESPCGFGDNFLEAMADLCKKLGYVGGKMWNADFQHLVSKT